MKNTRTLDIALSFIILVLTLPIFCIVILLGFLDTKKPILLQKRVGKHKTPFTLIKFRTMKINTPHIASHCADKRLITPIGKFLRKYKIDELPQLINVIKGEMSLVGPRPNLLNQHELIKERDKLGVYSVLPGITGLSQLSGIDMSTPLRLAESDAKMIQSITISRYFKFLLLTFFGKGNRDSIK